MDGRGIKRIIAEQREEVEFLLHSGPMIERELSIDRAFAHPNAIVIMGPRRAGRFSSAGCAGPRESSSPDRIPVSSRGTCRPA